VLKAYGDMLFVLKAYGDMLFVLKAYGDMLFVLKAYGDMLFVLKAYGDMLLTYLGKKFGEETEDTVQPEGVRPGNRIYLLLASPLQKHKALQRYIL